MRGHLLGLLYKKMSYWTWQSANFCAFLVIARCQAQAFGYISILITSHGGYFFTGCTYTTVYLFIYFRLWVCLVFNLTQKSSPYRANFTNCFLTFIGSYLGGIIRIIYCPHMTCSSCWRLVLFSSPVSSPGWHLRVRVVGSGPITTNKDFVSHLPGGSMRKTH